MFGPRTSLMVLHNNSEGRFEMPLIGINNWTMCQERWCSLRAILQQCGCSYTVLCPSAESLPMDDLQYPELFDFPITQYCSPCDHTWQALAMKTGFHLSLKLTCQSSNEQYKRRRNFKKLSKRKNFIK